MIFLTFKRCFLPAHYCGLPPIPIDGAVIPIKDSPCRYEYRCFNGAVLQGHPYADCNPATGEWDPIPTCKSENRIIDNNGKVFASEDLSTIDNKGKIFAESESSEDLSSVASSAPSSQKCNIFIITVVALLLLLNHL
jgi:hypothetical protein